MAIYFFEVSQLDPAHRAHFKTMHQQKCPGNELAVIANVAGDSMLVKVCCDESLEDIIPQGLTPHATYDLEQARALLQTPEWARPFP